MAILIKMPKLGLEMEQGTVLEWFFEAGDDVSEGDKLAEVESEKSIGEVEAREDGVLRRVYVEEGESVPPGTPIGILAGPEADISDLEAEAEAELEGKTDEAAIEAAATGSDAGGGGVDDQQAVATNSTGGGATETTGGGATEIKASPRARKRADELGVDLATVDGTGPMDSITAEDVEAATSQSEESGDSVKASPRAKQRADELGVDLTTVEGTGPMDSITAEDVEAAAEVTQESETTDSHRPAEQAGTHRYQQATAVADPATGAALLETTEAVRSAFEQRVTVADVMVLITSKTLSDRPLLNGTYAESTHQVQERQDIALAAELGTDPDAVVIENVEDKSLTEIVEARQAGEDSDARDPSFTLANGAQAASDGALINPPCVAGLELDPSGQRAVPDGDGVDLQPLVTAHLTYDTHAIGRSEAEAFLEGLFERAEQSAELVLGSYRGKE